MSVTRPKSVPEVDKGASAVIIAFAMVLLMGIAALALDASAGWNERRQDQTASDLGAVAGALSYGNNDAVVDQVLATSRQNIDLSYTDAEWSAIWATCQDPDRPPGFVPATSSSLGTLQCISLNPSFIRVRLPDQVIDTSFGGILGVDTLNTHAATIVTLLTENGTGLLPFAVRGNSTSGEICLDTGTGQIFPPCDGNESGSFGNIAPPLFGNTFINTSPECSHQTSANNNVAESIAMGIDHLLYLFTSAQWGATGWSPNDNTSNNTVDGLVNMDECIDNGGPLATPADGVPINGVYIDTGNSVKDPVTEGLITGGPYQDGGDARLTRSSDTRTLDGFALDNQPLWIHLLEDSAHGITACDRSTIVDDPSLTIDQKNDLMRACLETYHMTSSSAQIFGDSILDSPRLGIAPRLWHNTLGSGISYRPIKSFEIVYVHGIWLNDNNATPTTFFPDEDDNSPITPQKHNWEAEQSTAWLLEPTMVSQKVRDFYPGFINSEWQPTIYE